MEWYSRYETDVQAVFAEAERLIAQYPEPLNEKGLQYAAMFNPCRRGSTKNYICYLLPLWLDRQTGLPIAELRKLSLANVFVMLYFFLQDDVMDTPGTSSKEQLPLANLFFLQFLQLYRDMFPPDSPFWAYLEQYVREWSDSVTNEGAQNYFLRNISLLCRKASPVKLASTGALLLAGQISLIPDVSARVDTALVTLQMLDDWTDWQQDLEEGSYNGLLAYLQAECGSQEQQQSQPLTPTYVKQKLYMDGALTHYAEAAVHHCRGLSSGAVYAPYLDAFHESLLHNLVAEADRVKREKEALLMGGLDYILSNSGTFS
jgi:hypothetical protein